MESVKMLFPVFLIFLMFSVRSVHSQDCNIAYEDLCYELFSSSRLDAAEIKCKSKGGRLAIIKNAQLSEELAKHMRNFLGNSASETNTNRFWIGLNDTSTEGTFIYSDGSPLVPSSYTKWASGQPDNRDSSNGYEADCVSFSAFTEYWYDDSCTYQSRPFICEYNGKCNTEDIDIPNAEFDFCYVNKTVNSGTKLKIRCFDGFQLTGENYVKCQANSTWSALPACERGCVRPERISNSFIIITKEVYYVGDQVTYICDDGYYSSADIHKSHFSIHCDAYSEWSPNSLTCVKREKFVTEDVLLEPLASTKLQCNVDKNLVENFQKWLWLRNSENVYNISIEKEIGSVTTNKRLYSVDDDGVLTIDQGSELTFGYYTCFAIGSKIIPGDISYNVKISQQCLGLRGTNTVDEQLVKEFESLLLQCPHDPRLYSTTWYKNGVQLFTTNEIALFPDGSLLISQVRLSDKGEYVCEIFSKFSNCSEFVVTNLIVEASSASACGYPKDKGDQPWIVSLWWKDETLPFCYGSLIHEQWVLTTAQCLSGIFRKKVLDAFVRFGHKSKKQAILDVPFALVKIHPMFSKKLYVNDVGLVKLKERVSFSDGHLPVCLPYVDYTIQSPCNPDFFLEGVVSGWGPLEKDNTDQSPLMMESMEILPLSKCQSCNCDSSYSDKILCASKTNVSLPTYAGDSGSPLVIDSLGRLYLLGIYSWGERTAQLGQYDYFTKVSMYVPWIETSMNAH